MKYKTAYKKYIILALAVLAIAAYGQYKRSARISQAMAGPHVKINNAVIAVEVADSPGEHYRGLSGREKLDKHSGMLFVFQSRVQRKFVMRDMRFPLDIIWIDNGQVVKIDAEAPPEGPEPANAYSSGHEVSHVLEVNAGYARKKDIKAGDSVEINL